MQRDVLCYLAVCRGWRCFQKHILTDIARKIWDMCCADGIEEQGSSIMYKANVRRILTEGEGDQLRAVGVQLLDGRTFKGQVHLCCTFALLCSALTALTLDIHKGILNTLAMRCC